MFVGQCLTILFLTEFGSTPQGNILHRLLLSCVTTLISYDFGFASPSTYPCQSVGESFIVSDLEIAIASPSFASLFLSNVCGVTHLRKTAICVEENYRYWPPIK